MQSLRIALAIAILSGAPAVNIAVAQQNQPTQPAPRPRAIIVDPNFNRPPPVPHERQYVGPGAATAPPMERVTPVPPLAQPPIR
jgi:hypothetical protein